MTNLKDKILKKVKKIEKKPKWQFILKQAVVWASLVFAILLAAISTSMIIFQFQRADFVEYMHMTNQGPSLFLKMIPFFWIAVSAAIMWFVSVDFKKTKAGYKKAPVLVIFSAIVVSFFLAIIMLQTSGPGRLNEQFNHFKSYKELNFNPQDVWSTPEEGLLGGSITKLKKGELDLTDMRGNRWSIDTSTAMISDPEIIKPQNFIKIIGSKTADFKFKAERISQWRKM